MAGAVIGGALLSASLQVIFNKLASHSISDFLWRRKHEEQLLVTKLTGTLLSVEAILHETVDKRTPNSAVTQWLSELKATINEAQSLLDKIAARGSRGPSRSKGMQEILERLEHMSEQKDILDLIDSSYTLPTTSICCTHESEIYGRVGDKESIVSTLLGSNRTSAEEEQVQVMGILGVSGIGKTMLAQLVYNDRRVEHHFDLRVWVSLTSSRPDCYSVTKTIFEAVTSEEWDIPDLNLLQLRLGEQLVGKTILLVLDDLWSSIEDCTEWDSLRIPFRLCAPGSGIIVNTRNEVTAGTVRTVPVYQLGPILDEDSWNLFARHAFDDGRGGFSVVDPELEEIGRDIARKCRVLPIAAKALGILLRAKPDPEEWDRILKDDAWDSTSDMTSILVHLMRRTVKARARESGTGHSSGPSERNFGSNRARLLVCGFLWLVVLGISSTLVFKTATKFHAKQSLVRACDPRAKILQDQFEYHVNNSISLVTFFTQVRRLYRVLDDNQCGRSLHDSMSEIESGFPFVGDITLEMFTGNEHRNTMGCYTAETNNPLATLISDKMDISNAIATGETVISRPLKHSESRHLRFALIVPLYYAPLIYNATTVEHRIRAAAGYIGMIFEFDFMAEQVLSQLGQNHTILVAVYDVTNSSELLPLYISGDYHGYPYMHKTKLDLRDPFRKYMITCWYGRKAPVSWIIITITGLTIAIGLLLGCAFLGATIHRLRIQELEVQAKAADAARSSYLSAASREIGTPAISILEHLVLVLGMELRSPQKDYVRIAREGCKRLIDLIDDLVVDPNNPNSRARWS